MILVDTSVWVDHFRRRNARFSEMLERGEVVVHPFVAGEISLGALRNRDEILSLLAELPGPRVLTHEEMREFVERRRLFARGVGWVDVHVLASALIEHVLLWTLDRRLDRVARDLGVAWAG